VHAYTISLTNVITSRQQERGRVQPHRLRVLDALALADVEIARLLLAPLTKTPVVVGSPPPGGRPLPEVVFGCGGGYTCGAVICGRLPG
jgi:hypothetical protein